MISPILNKKQSNSKNSNIGSSLFSMNKLDKLLSSDFSQQPVQRKDSRKIYMYKNSLPSIDFDLKIPTTSMNMVKSDL